MDGGLFADGNVGDDDGILYIAAGCDADGGNYNGVFEMVFRGDHSAKFLEEGGVGGEKGFFFAAVEPVLDFERLKFSAPVDHAFNGISDGEFTPAFHIIPNIVLQALK